MLRRRQVTFFFVPRGRKDLVMGMSSCSHCQTWIRVECTLGEPYLACEESVKAVDCHSLSQLTPRWIVIHLRRDECQLSPPDSGGQILERTVDIHYNVVSSFVGSQYPLCFGA